MNLVDAQAQPGAERDTRNRYQKPDRVIADVRKLVLPPHHGLRVEDLDTQRLRDSTAHPPGSAIQRDSPSPEEARMAIPSLCL